MGVAIGCATRGRTVPFCSTFAAFFTRAFDQIRMGAISQTNCNFAGSHAGISIGKVLWLFWVLQHFEIVSQSIWNHLLERMIRKTEVSDLITLLLTYSSKGVWSLALKYSLKIWIKIVGSQALKYSLKIWIKILGSHFEELTRCETSRLGAIPCLISCLPQRMLHGKVKTF